MTEKNFRKETARSKYFGLLGDSRQLAIEYIISSLLGISILLTLSAYTDIYFGLYFSNEGILLWSFITFFFYMIGAGKVVLFYFPNLIVLNPSRVWRLVRNRYR